MDRRGTSKIPSFPEDILKNNYAFNEIATAGIAGKKDYVRRKAV